MRTDRSQADKGLKEEQARRQEGPEAGMTCASLMLEGQVRGGEWQA